MTTHYQYSDNVQPGDTVWVRWGRFGRVPVKVVKVYANGGLSCVRWNAKRERYTTPTAIGTVRAALATLATALQQAAQERREVTA